MQKVVYILFSAAAIALIVVYLSRKDFYNPPLSSPDITLQADEKVENGNLTNSSTLRVSVNEKDSSLTADEISQLLYENGSPDNHSIKLVWRWLMANPRSPHFKAVFNELMMTGPVEVVEDIIVYYHSMEFADKEKVIQSLGGILDIVSNPQEGDDIAYMQRKYESIFAFLESVSKNNNTIASLAFEALLSKRKRGMIDADPRSMEIFDGFLRVAPLNLSSMYPESQTAKDPQIFWLKKVAEYSINFRSNQSEAVEKVLSMLPTLNEANQKVILDIYDARLNTDNALTRIGGNELKDVVLTEESRRLIQVFRP